PAYGKVHFAKPPCCLVAFLTIDRNNTLEKFVNFSCSSVIVISVRFNKFFTLNEHTATAAAWVKNSALVRFEHFNKQLYYGTRRIELSAFFTLGKGKLSKKILIYLPKYIT